MTNASGTDLGERSEGASPRLTDEPRNDPRLSPDADPGPVPGLRGLSIEAQPQRDLWPGISARIAARRQRNRRIFLAAAACTLLAFAGMLSLRMTQAPEDATPAGARLAKAPIAAPPEFAALTSPRGLDLRGDRALVKANLRMAQSAEGEVRKAMRQSPGDQSLQRLLDSTNQQARELNELLLSDRN